MLGGSAEVWIYARYGAVGVRKGAAAEGGLVRAMVSDPLRALEMTYER